MDPLSLTANIIAVLSTVSEVSKKLKSLSSLRSAPQEILQFFNEISDIRVVLALARKTSESLTDDNSSGNTRIKAHLGELLLCATKALDEFDDIIQNKLQLLSPNITATKFPWRVWLQNAHRFRELSAALKTVRLDMNHALKMMTAFEIPRMRIGLAEITTQQSNTETILQRFKEQTAEQIEAVMSSVNTIKTNITTINEEIATPQKHSSHIRVQTSIFNGRSSCNQACLCRGHKFTQYISPGWLESLVGKLLIGYSGIPSRLSCNERICQSNNSRLLTVSYYFPYWFLGRCIISFRGRWSPIEGHVISIRTPRVLQSANEPIFIIVTRGDLVGMQVLFGQGLASPFDMCPVNFDSLLAIAVGQVQPKICEFLLNQYADVNIENSQGLTDFRDINRSPVDKVWALVLRRSFSPEVRALQNIFNDHLDINEKVQKWNLHILHRIIIGLSPIDLRAQLATSTAEIDSPCSRGRTPLHWAISQSNIEAIKILFEFGATAHLQDRLGHTPLYCAASFGTIEALEILLEHICSVRFKVSESEPEAATSQTYQGHTALGGCAYFKNRSEFARLLLDAGAHVDSAYVCPPPLLTALQMNEYTTLKLLLERGARLDLVGEDMRGTLHFVAIFSNIEIIQEIARQDKVEESDAGYKDVFNETPLEAFDVRRPQYTPEDEAVRQSCREAFLLSLSRTRNGAEDNASSMPRMEEITPEDSEDGEDVFYDFE